MAFLQRSEDVRLNYEVKKAESAAHGWVTLVCAYTRTLTDYKAMGRYLSERGWNVLSFDNRGSGKTDTNPDFTLDDMAEDILALWDEIKIEKSSLVGISLGGAIGVTLAARLPAALEKLCLVSTPVDGSALGSEAREAPKNAKQLAARIARHFSPAFLAKNQLLVQGFIRQMGRAFQEPDSALGARAQRDAVRDMDLLPLLDSIAVPTLVIHGGADLIVNVSSAKQIASSISKARLEIVPEMGHLLLAECPVRLYELVAGFLAP